MIASNGRRKKRSLENYHTELDENSELAAKFLASGKNSNFNYVLSLNMKINDFDACPLFVLFTSTLKFKLITNIMIKNHWDRQIDYTWIF